MKKNRSISRNRRRKRNVGVLLFSLLILIGLGGYYTYNILNKTEGSQTFISSNHEEKNVEYSFKQYTTSLTLSAIGDLLIHSTVYNDAKTADGYDFKPMIKDVKHLLSETDLTVANQETIVGGTEIGLSTYPSFNSPFEVADAIQDAGVDIVTIANNHTLDRGERAIQSATSYFDSIGMVYTGGYKNSEDRDKIRVLSKNGIDIAFLSYTYGTNGIPVPEGKDYLVNLIDMDRIKRDVEEAKKISDVVSVSMHWGNEYQLFPSDLQKSQAQELADMGVDLIIGHHPHVLQPMEWLKGKDGNDTFVIYSLGNFLSGQQDNYKDIGGVLQIEIVKEVKSEKETNIILRNPNFTPTYVTNTNLKNFKIVLLENAASVGLPNAKSKYEEIIEHMNQWLD